MYQFPSVHLFVLITSFLYTHVPIPVAARSKALVCTRLFAGIAGSKLVKGMDSVCCVLCRWLAACATGLSFIQEAIPSMWVCVGYRNFQNWAT
jgi:hypothetical protein